MSMIKIECVADDRWTVSVDDEELTPEGGATQDGAIGVILQQRPHWGYNTAFGNLQAAALYGPVEFELVSIPGVV